MDPLPAGPAVQHYQVAGHEVRQPAAQRASLTGCEEVAQMRGDRLEIAQGMVAGDEVDSRAGRGPAVNAAARATAGGRRARLWAHYSGPARGVLGPSWASAGGQG